MNAKGLIVVGVPEHTTECYANAIQFDSDAPRLTIPCTCLNSEGRYTRTSSTESRRDQAQAEQWDAYHNLGADMPRKD